MSTRKNRRQYPTTLNERELDKAKAIAEELGVTLSEAIRHAILDYQLSSD